MAHSLSAKKRVRQAEKHRARNRARKLTIKDSLKTLHASMTAGDVTKAEADLNTVVKRLDKVASKNTIHKNAAARKRSRLTKRLNALKAGTLTTKATGKGKTTRKAAGAGTKAATA